jgi:hypothetical protein
MAPWRQICVIPCEAALQFCSWSKTYDKNATVNLKPVPVNPSLVPAYEAVVNAILQYQAPMPTEEQILPYEGLFGGKWSKLFDHHFDSHFSLRDEQVSGAVRVPIVLTKN